MAVKRAVEIICIAPGCRHQVTWRRPICPSHWSLLPGRLRSQISLAPNAPSTLLMKRALAALAPTSSGGRPDAAPLPDLDNPGDGTAGVSAQEGRPIETPATSQARARGTTLPENDHA